MRHGYISMLSSMPVGVGCPCPAGSFPTSLDVFMLLWAFTGSLRYALNRGMEADPLRYEHSAPSFVNLNASGDEYNPGNTC